MTDATLNKTAIIRDLNDAFRRSFVGGVVLLTAGIEDMPPDRRRSLLQTIRNFDDFTADNDPHGEHDFGAIDEDETSCFWKIDYYDREMAMGSPDPADPSVTTRVLTVMLSEEYWPGDDFNSSAASLKPPEPPPTPKQSSTPQSPSYAAPRAMPQDGARERV